MSEDAQLEHLVIPASTSRQLERAASRWRIAPEALVAVAIEAVLAALRAFEAGATTGEEAKR